MEIIIESPRQNGDKNINLYSVVLGVFLSFLLVILCITSLFLIWFVENSYEIIFASLILSGLILIAWIFIRRCYYKIIFRDTEVILASRIFFLSRKIRYRDIYKIFIDKGSSKRRMETIDEYFQINHKDFIRLEAICKEKGLKIQID
jgi:hypothetical protein